MVSVDNVVLSESIFFPFKRGAGSAKVGKEWNSPSVSHWLESEH